MLLEIPPITCEVLHDWEDLDLIREEWHLLWNSCPHAKIFQTPEWLGTWWRHFGNGRSVLLILRIDGEMVCLLPIFSYRAAHPPMRRAALVGSGISDYLDALVHPGFEEVVAQELPSIVCKLAPELGVLEMHDLPAGSILLRCDWREYCNTTRTQFDVTLQLPLAASIDRSIPKPQLEKLHYYRRRLKRFDPGTWIEVARSENIAELFNALVRLHSARWGAAGKAGVLAEQSIQHFHFEVMRKFSKTGQLRLYGLHFKKQIAAVFYGFTTRQCTSFYLSGFDPQFAQYSLGTVLIGHAIEHAVQENHREFDFLRGAEPYKLSWDAQPIPTFKLQLEPCGNFAKPKELNHES